ncbi:MAG: K(+)-stimulated pyrophosphate-energized sodium pump [Candidatus Sumerlaeota bacterium]|nr:K(+)-stimulated pyrophosphate-energized sodium pump [Candidatus Sumerlaeota bacterium]
MDTEILIAGASGILALLFMAYLVTDVLKQPRGNKLMVEISDAVQEGAKAFLRREYMYIAGFVAVIFLLITAAPILAKGKEGIADSLGWQTGLAFIIGALASSAAGFIGMNIATRANSRTTEAARKGVEDDKNPEKGLKDALSVAISGGAVMGMAVVGIGLLGLVVVILIVNALSDGAGWGAHPGWINGYAMGASLVALFARSGGGIFTKGADMGADLVGKVEAGIPEDDPRNAATIADNVGDNVGDVAGLGADLMESYIEAMIAAMALAAGLSTMAKIDGLPQDITMQLQMLPLVLAAVGILASLIGVCIVKFLPGKKVQSSLMNGTYVSAILAIVGTAVACKIMIPDFTMTAKSAGGLLEGAANLVGVADGKTYTWLGLFFASTAGIVAGAIVGFFSEYYTSAKYKPVQSMARKCQMGPAITVTDGLALGMKSCALPILSLGIALLVAYNFGDFYGIALAAFGMLATTGMIVAVDSYGPIADNAGGCAEMAHLDKGVREITDNLDSVGNTTAAIGKGFAIGSAAFAALGLLVAYMTLAQISIADLKDIHVMFGLLLGGMVPFFFSALLFDAVSNAAFKMIDEVRRQLREIPGIMEGTNKPDYARCVSISTDGAIKGMLFPGGLAIVLPPIVGFAFGAEALAGFLIGALITGVMLGIMCANSGGAMDNAKKYIEEGKIKNDAGEVQGKGSEAHKAAVIGDTVGDPLKDTVGPSINILIKLMAVISLVLAPLFV